MKKQLLKKTVMLLIMALPLLAGQKLQAQVNCQTAIILSDTASNILAPHSDKSSETLWYSFTPNATQAGKAYTASTCGKTDDDTEIAIYEGTDCGKRNQIAYSDSDCGTNGKQSTAAFIAKAGKTYYFRWYNHSGTNNYNWELLEINPEYLFCQTPKVLTNTASNILAPHSDKSSETLWYSFTPNATQAGKAYYTASTCGKTDDDTEIAIYEGTDCGSKTRITFSDNVCGTTNGKQSTATFFAEAGKTYYFNWYNRSGTNNYNWELRKINTEYLFCRTPKLIYDTASNILAPHSDKSSRTLWYSFTPNATQVGKVYKVSTCGKTDDDTRIAIYEGIDCDNRNGITYSNSDCGTNGKQSTATFFAEAGKTYYFGWYNRSGTNNYNWELREEANPEYLTCQTPKIITDTASNILAPHSDKSSETLWYSFTPNATQAGKAYTASTCGKTDDDTEIAIYEGTCGSKMEIAYSYNACGTNGKQSTATFFAEAGKTYYFEWYNRSGTNNYNWELREEANLEYLTCQTPKLIYDTASDILAPHSDKSSQDLWYSFTPTATQAGKAYTASTCGKTDEDTEISIYEGTDCENLNEIAYSDDDCGTNGEQSTATFIAEAGKTYYFEWVNHSGTNNYNWELSEEANPEYITKISIYDKNWDEIDSITLKEAENDKLSFSTYPSNAAFTSMIWTSLNTNIATVDTFGKVTGINSGKTYVVLTATTPTQVLTDSCLVIVTTDTKQNQTIVWTQTLTATMGDAPITLTATASSDLTVSYTSGNTNVATISGNVLTIVGEGTATITAQQSGDDTYNSAVLEKTLTVNKKTGIKEIEISKNIITVYPNPTNGIFTISQSINTINSPVKLYNIAGKLVERYSLTGKEITIDISHLPSGIYLLKGGSQTVRIVKL